MTQPAKSKEQILCACALEDASSLPNHLCIQLAVTISGVIFKCKAHDMGQMCTNRFLPKQSIDKINDSGLKCLNIYLYV